MTSYRIIERDKPVSPVPDYRNWTRRGAEIARKFYERVTGLRLKVKAQK